MRYATAKVHVVGTLILMVCACSSDDSGLAVVSTTLPDQGDHTEYTGVAEGIWPPQPTGMTNVQPVPASARSGVLGGVIDAARSSVLNNPAVKTALGSDYREFEGSLGDQKLDTTATFVFYNYASNESVVAELKDDGSVVHEAFPAVFFQPAEHVDEVEDAIALGAQSLELAGFETAGLTGTAMLAFPPRDSLTDINAQFYPQRMMYITFGHGGGQLPVYSALVNLGSNTVSESGVVK